MSPLWRNIRSRFHSIMISDSPITHTNENARGEIAVCSRPYSALSRSSPHHRIPFFIFYTNSPLALGRKHQTTCLPPLHIELPETSGFHSSADASAHGTNVGVVVGVTAATDTVEYVRVKHVREEIESRRAGRGGGCRPCRAGEGGGDFRPRPPRLLLLAPATGPTAIVLRRSRPIARRRPIAVCILE